MAVLAVEDRGCCPYADGREFGAVGPYTICDLWVTHAVDPDSEPGIVGLDRAERDPDGRVRFGHRVQLLVPGNHSSADAAITAIEGRRLLIDVVNRGRGTAATFLDRAERVFPPGPEPEVGDGWLQDEGWALALVGWQSDISHEALVGLDAPQVVDGGQPVRHRVEWTSQPVALTTQIGLGLPGHRSYEMAHPDTVAAFLVDPATGSETAIDPGRLTVNARGTKLGLDTGFEAGAHYRIEYDTDDAPVVGCGLLAVRDLPGYLRARGRPRTVIGLGVSQTGRLLRQLVADGFDRGPDGGLVFDGLLVLIAGAMTGTFNDLGAQPGGLPADSQALRATWDDILSPETGPRVIALNTSSEYWRGDTAALHADRHPNLRVHHVAGTQHSPGAIPQTDVDPYFGGRAADGFNTIDYRPVARALLDQLTAWIEDHVEPTPSQLPSSLMSRSDVFEAAHRLGLDPPAEWSFEQPPGEVPTIGPDGNELGGIRLPDVAVPLGVHAAWNRRHPDIGAPDERLALRGLTRWFEDAQQRYVTAEAYLGRAEPVIDDLITQRLVRPADRQSVIDDAVARWNEATARVVSASEQAG